MPSKVKQHLNARKANVFGKGNTQFIPKEKNLLDLITGQFGEAEIRLPQGEKWAADLRHGPCCMGY